METNQNINNRLGEEMNKNVKPEVLGGFRYYLPVDMISREAMINNIRKVYEKFGFVPLDTPALERSEVLGTDDPKFSMEVYRFKAGDQDVTLRFDLTVPLARVVASNPQLPKPFKRYQIGKVWRKEKPQAGRFREFTQFDADIVGSKSMLADTEIIMLMYEALSSLGISNFLIRFNDRKILNALPEYAGFESGKIKAVLRILDKLDKIGIDAVITELEQKPVDQYDTAPGLSPSSIEKIVSFIKISGTNEEVLQQLSDKFKGILVAEDGMRELREIKDNLIVVGVPQDKWKIDLSIARGLDYYTGPVFETTLLDMPEVGSVFSGGRFDGLVGRFSGMSMPATGASVGLDRLYYALETLKKIKIESTLTQVLVTIFDPSLQSASLRIAQKLRNLGVRTELYLGDERTLKGQMAYAAKQNIPYVVIIGPDENNQGMVQLKDMNQRRQELLTEDNCFDILKRELVLGA
jgi:histidyl-tRNA synthetase